MDIGDEIEKERAHWDAVPDAQDAVWSEKGWMYGIAECMGAVLLGIGPMLHSGARVLDLGCGIGRLLFPLARTFHGTTWYGCDLSAQMLSIARAADPDSDAYLLSCDGRSLPDVTDLSAIYSVLMFQHIPAEVAAGYVRSAAHALRAGGRLRFQIAPSPDRVFLSHGHGQAEAQWWCELAGLRVLAIDVGMVRRGWFWVTAEKP